MDTKPNMQIIIYYTPTLKFRKFDINILANFLTKCLIFPSGRGKAVNPRIRCIFGGGCNMLGPFFNRVPIIYKIGKKIVWGQCPSNLSHIYNWKVSPLHSSIGLLTMNKLL